MSDSARKTPPDWWRKFDDPIPIVNGNRLRSSRDVANYVTALPVAEQKTERWQTVVKIILLIAEKGGDMLLARIAVMRALHHREVRSSFPVRRRRAKRFRVVS